jgi:hypothetical protein
MSASVAPVRIERVRPHRPMRHRDHVAPSAVQPVAVGSTHDTVDLLDLVDTAATSPLVVRWHAIRDRWARAREVWRQTTFYLFDGDSWRR